MNNQTLKGTSATLHHNGAKYPGVTHWSVIVWGGDPTDWSGHCALPQADIPEGLPFGDEITLQFPTEAGKHILARGRVAGCDGLPDDFWNVQIKGVQPLEL